MRTKIKIILSILISNQAYGFGLIAKPDDIFIRACRDGELAKVRVLIRAGANINENFSSPLNCAAAWGQTAIIKELLMHPNIDINMDSIPFSTPLMQASFYGHIEVVKLFLADPRIRVNKYSREGNTALICAAVGGRTEVVKILLANPYINVNLVNYGTSRALLRGSRGKSHLVLDDSNFEVYRQLVKTEPLVALDFAIEYRHLETAAVIQAHILNKKREQGNWERRRPWLLAVRRASSNVARVSAEASVGLGLE